MNPKSLDPSHFRSPLTQLPLSEDSATLWVDESGARFPVVGNLPLLIPDASLALAQMKNRAKALLGHYEQNIVDLKSELKGRSLSAATRTRLENTRKVQIAHVEFLRDLFAPLKLERKVPTPADADFAYRLPSGQGLQGYFPNLIRDWAPTTEENSKHLELVLRELRDRSGSSLSSSLRGLTAVIGSGGGRLAYDLHESQEESTTICCDTSPLLSLAASRLSAGERLLIAEFPVSPRNAEAASGVVRECKAPKAARPGLHHIIADAHYLPFADGSVDTVVTPWLVDILPSHFRFLISEINRVLKAGGVWVNSGSFNFRFSKWSDCLHVQEALELIAASGFATSDASQDRLPYLRSELDSHERYEWVTTFSAIKKTSLAPFLQFPLKPAWLSDPTRAIPQLPSYPQTFASLESQAFVLSAIDGQRTVTDIAALVSARYGLSSQDALEAVVSYIDRLESEAAFRPNLNLQS